ncbi:MAG: universal stress protein, partial [Blastocatellia bacterium]
ENERIRKMIEDAAIRLMDAGLIVTTTLEQEEPRKLLLQEAESSEADCLFLGARGMGAVERLMLGSVSSTVAARAHCSVEVIRIPPEPIP